MARIGYDFVAFPRAIWDDDLRLTLGEFRLLGYLIRHQAVWGGRPALITDDELLHGRKGPGGIRLDEGCGIKNANHLKDARTRLRHREWIAVTEDLADRARPKRSYGLAPSFTEEVSEKKDRVSLSTIEKGHPTIEKGECDYRKGTTALSKKDTLIRNRVLEVPEGEVPKGEGGSLYPAPQHHSSRLVDTDVPARPPAANEGTQISAPAPEAAAPKPDVNFLPEGGPAPMPGDAYRAAQDVYRANSDRLFRLFGTATQSQREKILESLEQGLSQGQQVTDDAWEFAISDARAFANRQGAGRITPAALGTGFLRFWQQGSGGGGGSGGMAARRISDAALTAQVEEWARDIRI